MINTNFSHYVANSSREYKFTLKLACEDVTDKDLDLLELALAKYNVKSASKFKKTPIQESPLDFPNVKNTAVFISEIVLEYPATSDALRVYLSEKLNINQQQVAVYTEHDPRRTNTEEWLNRHSPEYKAKYESVLTQEYPASDNSSLYGETYNKDFLKELQQLRSGRADTNVESKLIPPQKEDDNHSQGDMGPMNNVSLFGRDRPKKTPSLMQVK